MAGWDQDRDGNGGEPDRDDWNRDGALETERLALDEDDAPLPWLESGDEEFEEEQGSGTGRILGLVVGSLVALAAIVGGIWWATHRNDGGALVADGSVIAAPKQPYKEAPKDPGGKTFAGTGDSSFVVSEGQTRPARLGDDSAPVAQAAPAAPAKPGSAPVAPATPAPAGVGVQVAAYSNQAQAEAGWTRLSSQYEALSGLHHRVVEGRADIGTVYRLQVMAADLAGAQALCGRLKAAGLACQVKH